MLVHQGPLTMHLVVHSPMSQSGRNVNAGSPGSVNDAPSGTQPNVTIWEECQCWFARVR